MVTRYGGISIFSPMGGSDRVFFVFVLVEKDISSWAKEKCRL